MFLPHFVICLVLPECLSGSEANRDGADAEFPFLLFFSLFLPRLKTLAHQKGRKIVFVLRLVGRVSVSISLTKYSIFPSADNGCSREKKFWQSDLLTPSVSTVEIWSTLTYTEFDCVALLAML